LDQRIQWAMAYIERNLDRRLLIRELAHEVNLSHQQFGRLFRAECGFSPAQYLKAVRVRHAKELLEQTFLSVKEISSRLGMDESHLMREFRHVYGSSPGRHRSRALGQPFLAVEPKTSTGNVQNRQQMFKMANEFSLP
jgi:transcriptional regulator GlxA family with amidase domain